MHSVYYCKKCSIDFPSVSRYVKHRKLFCQLGRGKEDLNEGIPEDGIGKLSIAEATKRISRAIELRTKEVDPAVYHAVEQVRLYKKKIRSDGKKINEQRNEVLKRLADLKQEMRELEATFTEKNKKYESIKAYSKVSALEVTGTEELLDELHDLKNAIVYLEDEIASNIDCLHLIESGKYKPSEARLPEKPDTVLDNISSKRNIREHSTRKHSTREHSTREHSTRERIQLPALKIHTPLLTPLTKPVTRDLTRDLTPTQEVDGREHSRATSAPRVSVRQTIHSLDNDTASVVSARTLKPGSADSVVLLGKLQRKRDIILLKREIQAMEQGEEEGVRDVLSDSALIPYLPESGVVVYIDYLTPTFHISANLMLTVIRDSKIVCQTSTFIVTPASHVSFLGYHETFPNLAVSNDTYLYSSIRTLEGEELGWCLFNLFSDRTLNSGAWRIPLKSPPFSHDLVSTLYHGARSLNYSLRLRCSVTSVHDAMLTAPKLKLAQYKIHNPGFEDRLIISNNVNKPENKQILRKGNKSTPIRPMPAPAKTATPAVELLPVPEPPEPTETPERIKGLHYHTLILNQPSLPPSLSVHVQYCEIDEEYNIKNSVSFPSSSQPVAQPFSTSTL
ncbi:uncharacterized protein LOC134814494 isoform X2 [Bolinopsis microptera]|uniref:uncharacterized protein LOC134814494 isoform X2 n=1 Tax=Bolinopsis microptera TaxID=2820187 RepID=UPI00307A4625